MSAAVVDIAGFLDRAGWAGAERGTLAGDASARRYERLRRGPESAVLMIAPPADDLGRFIRMADWLRAQGLSAPALLAQEPGAGLLLLEDLGDDLVSRLVAADPAREAPLYAAITDLLGALRQAPLPAFLTRLDAPALADLLRLTPECYPHGY